jgi:hypothetical protein
MKLKSNICLFNFLKPVLEKIGFLLILCIFLSACNNYPIGVKKSLTMMGKENRLKFEKVFEHFNNPHDSLKLKAAYFLVENITGLGHYEGKQLRDYNVIFDILANKPADFRENIPWYANGVNELFDSLQNIYGQMDFRNLHFVKDVDVFTTESFIQYINGAFDSWQNPWSKNVVSFDDFCNYVLPYRNFNEPIEPWREIFTEKFKWIHDSLKENDDIIDIARKLNRNSELKYSDGFGRYIVSIPPSLILKAMYGACTDNSNYKAMIMRSFGIPATIDYLPQYGNDHNTHYWNSVMDHNGNFVSFEEALNDINAFVAYKYKISKVYRKTFSRNKKIEKLLEDTKGDVPQTFKEPKFFDVTQEYVAVTNVKLQLKNIPKSSKYVYVGVFNDAGWTAIDYTEITDNKYAIFKNLGRDVLYLPLYYTERKETPASLPFTISKKGTIQYIEPKKETCKLKLTRKYYMHRRKINWLECLKDGRFEGANKPDFSDAITLAKIKETAGEHFEELSSYSNSAFKYLRFVFSNEELKLPYDGDGASIGEIEFIAPSGKILKGSPIGSIGRKYNPYTPKLCFDDNPQTFFEDARSNIIDKYVGLKLENPTSVTKISYIARNDMNSIQPSDEYELFYWDNENFISLGKKVALDKIIEFVNVPKGSLLWLRDLSSGKEERIFTWENGKQIWW